MILLFGDPHGRFDHVHSVVAACRPAALILLGDIEAKRPLEMELAPIADLTQIWFIHGNHDTDSDAFHDNLFCSSLRERNLHGRVVEIDGKRVAGLGGVFRGHVWMPPQPPSYRSPEEFVAMCGKGNRWREGCLASIEARYFSVRWRRFTPSGLTSWLPMRHQARILMGSKLLMT